MGSIAITCCSTKEEKILENDADNLVTDTKPIIYKYPHTPNIPIFPSTYVYNTPEINNLPRTLSSQTIFNN